MAVYLDYSTSTSSMKRNLKPAPDPAAAAAAAQQRVDAHHPHPIPTTLAGPDPFAPPPNLPAAMPAPSPFSPGPRKRKGPGQTSFPTAPPPVTTTATTTTTAPMADVSGAAPTVSPPATKKSRTNTPWTPAEEQRLKTMRDAGSSWSEIAKVRECPSLPSHLTAALSNKGQTRPVTNTTLAWDQTFPTRTEGSVKKHWYKDMHYAEFGEDESAALLSAIKEYEASKWKVIGQKVGKPAKVACEQYAKEHFGGRV
ncbi:MAG: hypothetical protein M1837_001963 [Sclerophora amabilis]|nr:MAG: hypothetical protein M1837_001963 [Sclerophora amabilis]